MAEITQCTTVTGLLKSDKPRRGARENITYLVLNRSELLVVLFRSNIWGHSQSTNNKTEADEEKFLRFNRWLPGEYVGRKMISGFFQKDRTYPLHRSTRFTRDKKKTLLCKAPTIMCKQTDWQTDGQKDKKTKSLYWLEFESSLEANISELTN